MKQTFLKITPLILGLLTSLQAMDNEMDVEMVSKKREMEIDVKEVDVKTVSPKKHRKNYVDEMDVEARLININSFEAYGVPTDLNLYIADLSVHSITSMITLTISSRSNSFLEKLNPAEIIILLKTVFKKECSEKKYTFNEGKRSDRAVCNGDQCLSKEPHKTLCANEHEDQFLNYWLEKAKICDMRVCLRINSMRHGLEFATNMNIICYYLNHMSSLDLGHNYIGLPDYSKFLDRLKNNTTLTSLNLSGNYISSSQIKKLGEMLEKNTTLTCLSVSLLSRDLVNKERAAAKVAGGLLKNTTLTHLDMTFNDLEFYVGNMVSDGLKGNTTLKSLILQGDCGDRAIKNICSLLEKNKVLTTLNLTGTDHLPLMIDSLIQNKTLTSMVLSNYGLCDYNRVENYNAVKNIPNLVSLEKVGYQVVIENNEDVMYDGLGSSYGHVKVLVSRGCQNNCVS